MIKLWKKEKTYTIKNKKIKLFTSIIFLHHVPLFCHIHFPDICIYNYKLYYYS